MFHGKAARLAVSRPTSTLQLLARPLASAWPAGPQPAGASLGGTNGGFMHSSASSGLNRRNGPPDSGATTNSSSWLAVPPFRNMRLHQNERDCHDRATGDGGLSDCRAMAFGTADQ